jgi:hypothetical protein
MTELSVDYACLAGDLKTPPAAASVGAALLAAVAERYESRRHRLPSGNRDRATARRETARTAVPQSVPQITPNV